MSPSPATPEVVNEVSRDSGTGTETPGSGGKVRGRTSAVLPLSYICHPQSSYMFKADRFRPEPIPRDAVLQDVQPRLSETGSGSSSVVEEPGSETRLPPYTDRTELSQVSSLIVLGEAVVL